MSAILDSIEQPASGLFDEVTTDDVRPQSIVCTEVFREMCPQCVVQFICEDLNSLEGQLTIHASV